jgi:hypothetical protein
LTRLDTRVLGLAHHSQEFGLARPCRPRDSEIGVWFGHKYRYLLMSSFFLNFFFFLTGLRDPNYKCVCCVVSSSFCEAMPILSALPHTHYVKDHCFYISPFSLYETPSTPTVFPWPFRRCYELYPFMSPVVSVGRLQTKGAHQRSSSGGHLRRGSSVSADCNLSPPSDIGQPLSRVCSRRHAPRHAVRTHL